MRESIATPEILVEIRTAGEEIRTAVPKPLGSIAAGTELETKPETVLFSNTSACCEDCPDIKDNPPDKSECPYFEVTQRGWPVCTREGNSDQQLNQFFLNQ